jgi:hypothetical protein
MAMLETTRTQLGCSLEFYIYFLSNDVLSDLASYRP